VTATLPPIPPTPPSPPTDTQPPAPSAGRRVAVWPVVAASVLSAALAAGATVALDDDPGPAAPAPTEQAAPEVVRPTAVADGADAAAVAADRVAPAVVQIQTRTGVGSGVVYDRSGLVLTVAHVVGTSPEVIVRMADGRSVEGEVLGAHAPTDVAVVRIDAEAVLGVAELATGDQPIVGQLAVAVGSPFGFDQTVTSGIVSAVDRVVNEVAMVQTDAAINPGNSGGPLVDAEGRVLGLNDVIFTESGSSAGVGFAIQIDLAQIVADQLVAGGAVRLALLGVSTTAAPAGEAGAQVAAVVPGSAADQAGLQVGDRIVSLDGEPVPDGGRLRAQVIRRAPGDQVTLTIARDGEQRDIDVTLGATG
jgi:S1-C subfamily serine protease